jgi:hypothetical protein
MKNEQRIFATKEDFSPLKKAEICANLNLPTKSLEERNTIEATNSTKKITLNDLYDRLRYAVSRTSSLSTTITPE